MKKIILIFFTTICFYVLSYAGAPEPVNPVEDRVVDKREFFSVATQVSNIKNPECEILVLKHFDETGLWIVQVDKRDSTKAGKYTVDDLLAEKVARYGKIGVYYSLNKLLDEEEIFRSLASSFKEGIPSIDVKYEFKGANYTKNLPINKLRYFTEDYSNRSCLD